jgi:hypothetical protein
MKHGHVTVSVLLVGLLSGCATARDPESEARRQLVRDLRKACIEAAGGTRMDAIDLYGGRLSTGCSAWAYDQARRAFR